MAKNKSYRDIGSAARRQSIKNDLINQLGVEEGTKVFEGGMVSQPKGLSPSTNPATVNANPNKTINYDVILNNAELRSRGYETPKVNSIFTAPQIIPEINPLFPESKKTVTVKENVAKIPFMAMDVDKRGIPIYGIGIAGWARKAWADLTDPQKYFQDADKLSIQQKGDIEINYSINVAEIGQRIEENTKWSKWGEKITGISSKELAQMPAGQQAELQIAKEAGLSIPGTVISRTIRTTVDTAQNVLWAGVDVLMLGDKTMRKIHATREGIDVLADRFDSEKQQSFFDVAKEYTGINVINVASNLLNGNLKWSEAKDVIQDYQRGSAMAYTLMFDNKQKEEFQKGLAEGRDPIILAQDLGNIGIELAGSILGDPVMYMGLGIVKPVNIWSKAAREGLVISDEIKIWKLSARLPWKTVARIPTFGEIIGAGAGAVRLRGQSLRYVEPIIDNLPEVLKTASETGDLSIAKQLIKQRYSTDAVNTMGNLAISKKMKWWNLAAPDSIGKVNIASRDANLFIQSLVANNGLDESLKIVNDMVAMRSKDALIADKAITNLIGRQNEMIFSPVGEMVGEIFARLDPEVMANIIKAHPGDANTVHKLLKARLSDVIHEFIPSVDEMAKASASVKKIYKTSGPEITLARQQVVELSSAKTLLSDIKVTLKDIKLAKVETIQTYGEEVTKLKSPLISAKQTAKDIFKVVDGQIQDLKLQLSVAKNQQLDEYVKGIQAEIKRVRDFRKTFKAGSVQEQRYLEDFVVSMQETLDEVVTVINDEIVNSTLKLKGAKLNLDTVAEELKLMKIGGEDATIILNKLEKAEKFADMYNDVPNVVKVIHKITRLPEAISKAASRAMVYTFMNLVPRALIRNLEGVLVPVTMRLNLATALDVAISGLTSLHAPTAEKLISSIDDETRLLIGFIPDSEGIGKIVGAQGKGIWKYGFLPSIKRSEEIMAKKIILQTIKNEIQNALPAVIKNMPEWDAMISTLPKEQQALPFLAFTKSNGNIDDAFSLVKKWVGKGEIETWRLVEPPPALRKYLDDNGLLTNFRIAQDQAKSDVEFKAVIDGMMKQYHDFIIDEAMKLPHTNTKMPEALSDWGLDFSKNLKEENVNIINDVILSWRNTQDSLATAKNGILNTARNMANQATAAGDGTKFSKLQEVEGKLQGLENALSKEYQEIDFIRKGVVENVIHNITENTTSIDRLRMYETPIGLRGKEEFLLSRLYPDLDVMAMKNSEFKQIVWSAMFETTASKFRNSNLFVYETTMGHFDEISKIFGGSLDDIVGSQKAGDGVFKVLIDARNQSMKIEEVYAWKRFFRQRSFNKTIGEENLLDEVTSFKKTFKDWDGDIEKIVANINDKNTAKTNIAIIAQKYKIPSAGADGQLLDKNLLKIINTHSPIQYKNLDDVPVSVANLAFSKFRSTTPVVLTDVLTIPATKKITASELTLQDAIDYVNAKKLVAPYDGRIPNEVRTLHEGLPNFEIDAKLWAEKVVSEWGVTQKTIPTDLSEAMQLVKTSIKPRIDRVKLEAAVTGISTRNFVLHDYNKTYLDHALTYALGNSFHYWTTRTYMRSIESLVESPKYAGLYMNYRDFNIKRHADLPDWYKQSSQINNLLGIPLNNPYMVNFESAINPMYGLVDYNFDDSRKTVDWVTRSVNDMNKNGPTFSPFISWAIAMHAYNIGEQEAGRRWFNVATPQTALIKSATAKFFNNPVELDPFANLFGGGVGPYEEMKVKATLANMVANNEITREQMIDAVRTMKGNENWEKAVLYTAQARFGTDMSSFFLGAGVKPRTLDDIRIEKFWSDYKVLLSSKTMLTPEEYRQSWDTMRDNPDYGNMMDVLLLSRNAGEDMDSAFVYNVFGRIPPGELNDVATAVGIDKEVIQSFYDNKGDFKAMGLTQSDRDVLMARALDISLVYNMPDSASRKDWSLARTQYKEMNTAIEKQFGTTMLSKMDAAYSNKSGFSDYLDQHPDVQAAFDFKDAVIVNNPTLMKYYGNIDTVARYYTADNENKLAQKYGKDIQEAAQKYLSLTETADKTKMLQEYSKLKSYQVEYANAKTVAEDRLKADFGDMTYALEEYASERALRDPKYKKEIYNKYQIGKYKSKLNPLVTAIKTEINTRYGEEIVMDARAYAIASAERKDELENKYSPLQAYLNEQALAKDAIEKKMVEIGNKLPETPKPETRIDMTVQSATQKKLLEYSQPKPDWNTWKQILTPETVSEMEAYAQGEEKLPSPVYSMLKRVAGERGYYSVDALIRDIMISMQ